MMYGHDLHLAPIPFTPPRIIGLPEDLQDQVNELVTVWARKRPRNQLRQLYMDAKRIPEGLNIAVPEVVAKDLGIVSSWPEKAVYGLANRCMWDGVVAPSGEEDPFELASLLHANRFDLEISQTIASSMIHSVAFITTTLGDVASGEPDVLIRPYTAQWASAIWDRRTRSLRCALTIDDIDDLARPTALTLITATQAVECRTSGAGWFVSRHVPHGLRRVPVEPLPFKPSLDRQMGRSRISRPVMAITDRAIRTALRMDVAAEFLTTPGLLLNGITEEQWAEVQKWSWRLGAVRGLSRTEEGELVDVERLPQQSVQPFVEQLRELAGEFSAATSLPLSALGIVQDNPSSADAIYAAKEELVIEATVANRGYGYALARVYQNAVMLRDGLSEPSGDLTGISTRWRNPAIPSVVSQSDAMVKQISAIPALAETDVALEELGYTAEQIARIRAQMARSQAKQTLTEILGGVRANEGADTGVGEDVPS
ncbi:phage portal protein [Actinobaculum sp. 352]|uniref:phage portal protein n=1 Tax=Actinobaculum sp. 352 TaxID=2490946 RepID=UPI000F7EDB88|nr:phage portal protein [Actinobaculum sp. 352]RTE48817.1 phage portal protein [Actinobaculum sp. 352]